MVETDLTLVHEEEDSVGGDCAVGEEDRVELDVRPTKVQKPLKSEKNI